MSVIDPTTKTEIVLDDLYYELVIMANDKLNGSKNALDVHTKAVLRNQAVINELLGKICSENSVVFGDFTTFSVDTVTKKLTLEKK